MCYVTAGGGKRGKALRLYQTGLNISTMPVNRIE